MSCSQCSSLNEAEFTSELMIHFSGPSHLANPGVLAFPKILICLDCGASRFNTPTEELRSLREGAVALSAAA
jgi:hypothetical protein